MSTTPTASTNPPTHRHAVTPLEKQRSQLERLLKDPSKPAFIPLPPKEKTIRAPRDMMKNVQGSSAGAGSGEFHVYKASRRREYERIKLMEEESQKVRRPYMCISITNFPSIRKPLMLNLIEKGERRKSKLMQKRRRTELNDRRRKREPRRKAMAKVRRALLSSHQRRIKELSQVHL